MKTLSRFSKTITTFSISTILCLCSATVANATTTAISVIRYPVSSGTQEGGFWWAKWNAQVTVSSCEAYSFSTGTFCEVGQDGYMPRRSDVSAGVRASASVEGTQNAHYDYVKYGTK